MNCKPKVLFISGTEPLQGPGRLIYDYYLAFKRNGIEADFLFKYPIKDNPQFLSVYDSRPRRTLFDKLIGKFKYAYNLLFHRQRPDHYFFYKREEDPPVPPNLILSKIQKEYNMVIIQSWIELVGAKTVLEIYRKLRCPVFFYAPDYCHMSGGCHFPGDCEKYKTGCIGCKAVYPSFFNTFPQSNVKFRKLVYQEVRPISIGNQYMNSFTRESFLLKDLPIEDDEMIIDTDLFRPYEKLMARARIGIDEDKFVLLFGCQALSEKRKGISYLLDALEIWYSSLNKEQREQVLVVSIGKNSSEIKERIQFKYKELGFIDFDQLPLVYSAASLFLCPSVNDAGPMMVNQSLSCGTPVVAFEMGTAIDCIKGRGTGYCAELRNAKSSILVSRC